jgi:hypothetical protein
MKICSIIMATRRAFAIPASILAGILIAHAGATCTSAEKAEVMTLTDRQAVIDLLRRIFMREAPEAALKKVA